MPAIFNAPSAETHPWPAAVLPLDIATSRSSRADEGSIHIGLVNNMPDSALRATERQFRALLDAASEGMLVRVSLFVLPDIARSGQEQRHITNQYSSVDDLWHRCLDGLIVTGAEPVTPHLWHEPYWGSMERLAEWAEHRTHSSIWSCLAAHAALLHIDSIERRPLREKVSGVFECSRISDNPLTAGIPSRTYIPHSRLNDIPEDALTERGYRILTRSAQVGADTFVKQRKSMFVFFQGHPEYDADSLLLEFRRDIRRYLRRERDTYPSMPHGCFDDETTADFSALRERALSDRSEELLSDFPTPMLAARVTNTWRQTGICLYRNWLRYLRAQKERQMHNSAG